MPELQCPACGAAVEPGSERCGTCGLALRIESTPGRPPATASCAACGATIPPGAAVCPQCGRDRVATASTPDLARFRIQGALVPVLPGIIIPALIRTKGLDAFTTAIASTLYLTLWPVIIMTAIVMSFRKGKAAAFGRAMLIASALCFPASLWICTSS